jgi:hypothetical protein
MKPSWESVARVLKHKLKNYDGSQPEFEEIVGPALRLVAKVTRRADLKSQLHGRGDATEAELLTAIQQELTSA